MESGYTKLVDKQIYEEKFIGWIAFEPDFPLYEALKQVAKFQNELSADGYVTYMTYTAAGERVSDEIGIIFSTKPVSKEEAQKAFDKFLMEDDKDA